MDRNANVFKFQGSKMIVSAKGPNINKNFTMDTSFRPNLLSSTMNMPRNFKKQSSAASVASSQRSMYHGRDTSPTASICSDLQPRNFHQPFYSRGFSQRSLYNDRAVSPVSMRSIDSTASRADIVIDAIKSCTYTEDEWEKIWHTVNRKHEFRKKAQKRQKMKMFLKNLQNRSEDEGEQGSHSSISNDDCASTRTGYSRRYRYDPYSKGNIPRSINSYNCRSEDMYGSNNRDGYSGYAHSDSQNPYQTNNCPSKMLSYQNPPQFGPTYLSQRNGLSQNYPTLYSQNNTISGSKNTFSQRHMTSQATMSSIQRNTLNASICSTKSMQNMTMMSQRDRFRSGFQFPSQKFNRSTLYEEHDQVRNKQFPKKDFANNIHRDQIDELSDENNDIFLDTTVKPNSFTKKSKKRKADTVDDIPNPTKKKPKITPINDKVKKQLQSKENNKNNEFEFVKPQFPVKKSAPTKPQEKLISKSSGAPDLCSNEENENPNILPIDTSNPVPDAEPEQSENPELTTSDLSMRPSFLKRKLFTQTLDVTERKNNSFDSGSADSPQSNIYSALTREKHKTRKLVTSQSLLSRDVNQDDDNLLDLIHKIVPPNQVNSTITANNTKPRVSDTKNGDDKWDITSIISTCNNDSVSETYTDDEIFKVGNDDTKSKQQEKPSGKNIKTDNKNKVDKVNKVGSNKPESKKSDNNVTPTNSKSLKDISNINAKNNKNVKGCIGNVNPTNTKNDKEFVDMTLTNNKNVNATDVKPTNSKNVAATKPKNNKNIKDVGDTKVKNNKNVDDTKVTNNKNVKDVDNKKVTNIKKVKGVDDTNVTNNKNVKDVDDTKVTNSRNAKDIVDKKLTSNKNNKNLGEIKMLNTKNSKDFANINTPDDKNFKEVTNNKYNTMNKNGKDFQKKTIQAAPTINNPMTPCPAKRVMKSRSRIDAFWDTDESDYECAATRRDLQPLHPQDQTGHNEVIPKKGAQANPDTQPTISTKITIANKILNLSPLVVLQDVEKDLKKQMNKKIAVKTQPKPIKKSNDNVPKKIAKNKDVTPTITPRTRRQINLSATLESVNYSDLNEKDISVRKEVSVETAPTKTTIQKKQKSDKKGTQDKTKSNRTKLTAEVAKSQNKKQNDSLIDNSNKRVATPISQKYSKTNKLQKSAEHMKIDICKVLRSRNIDLSDSFNSDKFELTMSRTRKSRTPIKRICFNKSKNLLANNKIRNRATKS